MLRIGTRGSRLALAQAALVRAGLLEPSEVVVIRTAGDDSPAPLRELADGAFVGALEAALARGEIDIAVHSLKDLPTAERPALVVAAVPAREDPRDVLITRARGGLATLGAAARVGTSSPRRAAFLAALSPASSFPGIRGNVETRLRKVEDGEYDATVVALAGLRRLALAVGDEEILSVAECPPAPGQGALAIQCRRDDAAALQSVAGLDDPGTHRATDAERALLREMGASCEIPLGAFARLVGETIVLEASLVTAGGIVRATALGTDPAELGARAAAALRAGTAGA